MKPLKVCIDARVRPDIGGISTFVIGLATGLSNLNGGNEEYFFSTYRDAQEWLRPYLGGACQILPGSLSPQASPWKSWIKKRLPLMARAWGELSPRFTPLLPSPPKSDGAIEAAGVDVMHFTHQMGFLTGVPSIYHPHDLQYIHLPQYFSKREVASRDIIYRTFCRQAGMVAVSSSWTKRDLLKHYGLPEPKVQVIPLAPIIKAYDSPSETDLFLTKKKFNLPDQFIFYPAHTWHTKNHLGLLQALHILRQQHNLSIPFVSSGRLTSFYPTIKKRAQQLRLAEQTKFLDFVSPMELQCLYRLCRAVVIPTQFEAASFPLWEAFLAGAPTACSNVTSLPEQAGDAALIFDPDRPEEMAAAILKLWVDDNLRQTLIKRGSRRVAAFSWDRTARLFRAHYRRLASRHLTDEDKQLLADSPLL